jgi:hypothetical protein
MATRGADEPDDGEDAAPLVGRRASASSWGRPSMRPTTASRAVPPSATRLTASTNEERRRRAPWARIRRLPEAQRRGRRRKPSRSTATTRGSSCRASGPPLEPRPQPVPRSTAASAHRPSRIRLLRDERRDAAHWGPARPPGRGSRRGRWHWRPGSPRQAARGRVFAGGDEEIVRLLGVDSVEMVRYEGDRVAVVMAGWGTLTQAVSIQARVPVRDRNLTRVVLRTRRAADIEARTSSSPRRSPTSSSTRTRRERQ